MQKSQTTPASSESCHQLAPQEAGEDMNHCVVQWLNGSGGPEWQNAHSVVRRAEGDKVRGQFKQELDLFRLSLFFFNDTATTEIYTLSLHDALPIFSRTREMRICTSVKATQSQICPQ